MLSLDQTQQINRLLMQASSLALSMYDDYVQLAKDIGTSYKPDKSPVTAADLAVHELMVARLGLITPHIACLSEESADNIKNRRTLDALWLLDPIDGTREFIGKSGQFTINLALIHAHKVVAAWLVVPKQKRLYFFTAEHKVSCMDFSTAMPQARQILPNCQPLQTRKLVRVGLSNNAQLSDYAPFLNAITTRFEVQTQLVQAGSALKYAMLLEDDIDVYIRLYPTYEWDTAAGQGLVESIGGKLINFRGRAFLYNARDRLKNGGFVCFKCVDDAADLLHACKRLVEEN